MVVKHAYKISKTLMEHAYRISKRFLEKLGEQQQVSEKPFFVFYLKIPRKLRMFLLKVSAVFLLGFFATGLLLGITQDDPGEAGYRGDYGRQKLVGILQMDPYPLLWVTSGTQRVPVGHTLMLTGNGKFGVRQRAKSLDGKLVQVEGVIIKRGELDMLQIRGGKRGIDKFHKTDEEQIILVPPPVIELGKWKIAGEICDGKCLAGAMNPGRGIAHKACANLCLLGDIPPVFVTPRKVHGSNYFLMANQHGEKIEDFTYEYIGEFVEMTGEIEQRGDLLIFKTEKIVRMK